MQNQLNNNPGVEKKGINKFWIIGGIAAFLILFFGFLAIVAGITGWYYFSQPDTEFVETNTNYSAPKDDKNSSIPKHNENDSKPLADNNNDSDVMSDTNLEYYMQNDRKTVGSYSLDNVQAFKGNDFPARVAGVTAHYTKGTKKVVHSIAMFDNYKAAADDFNKYKKGIKSLKGSKVRSNEEDRIIFSYEGSVFLTFCNKAGGCHELNSKDGDTILDYYESYFGKSQSNDGK